MKEKIKLEHYRYSVSLKKHKISSLKREEKGGKIRKVRTFQKPVTKAKLPKIYLIKQESDIVYVGATSQGIRNRLRYGLQAKGRGGYHGYAFKGLNQFDMFIWIFPNEKPKIIETIEAEIVYLIRNKTGEWPKYQTEIHFHNATKKEKKVANLIYKVVSSKY